MYLTFSESFEKIEPILQKILADPKNFFSKIGKFPVKGELPRIDRIQQHRKYTH